MAEEAATRFRKRIESLGLGLKVDNSSVNSIPADADVVVCQEGLASRAKGNAPTVRIVAIKNFLEDPALDALYEELASRKDVVAVVAPLESEEDKSNSGVLALTSIKVGAVCYPMVEVAINDIMRFARC